MAKTDSLKNKVAKDFPSVTFASGNDFYWSPATTTVFHGPINSRSDELTLLHEVAHALLDHREFARDIDLLKIEREAWDYVTSSLAPRYDLQTDIEMVEDAIDTYREWLHARSRCPRCSLTGIQIGDSEYHCLGCDHNWRVNDARRCGLRRYTLSH